MKEQAEVRSLKEGRYVIIDDEPCKIVSIDTSKPGKHGSAKANVVAIGIFTGTKRSLQAPVSERVYIPQIDKRRAQVISVHAGTAQLMDMETYQTFDMPVPEEFQATMEAGKEIEYLEALGKRMITRA